MFEDYTVYLFRDGEEMLNALKKGVDFYSPYSETYVFLYNDDAVASYSISYRHAEKLEKDSEKYGEYWSALLGPGGWIHDNYEGATEDFCDSCCDDAWIEVGFGIANQNRHSKKIKIPTLNKTLSGFIKSVLGKREMKGV